jgi:hypothetical protein
MDDAGFQIQEIVDRETRAWDTQYAELLLGVFHPDMVWPWPKTSRSHDPMEWCSSGAATTARGSLAAGRISSTPTSFYATLGRRKRSRSPSTETGARGGGHKHLVA